MGSLEGRGPQTNKNTCRKVPIKVNFFITTFGIAFYQCNLSTSITYRGAGSKYWLT